MWEQQLKLFGGTKMKQNQKTDEALGLSLVPVDIVIVTVTVLDTVHK